MLVAFAMDVIQIATLHLHMCYVIVTTVVCGLQLSTSTLWNLFQGMTFAISEHAAYIFTGKCYNQLCNRNDKWFYEMDHLVLGTIFFTLATFLMPTILIYQAFFSTINGILHLPLNIFDSNFCKPL